MTAESKLAQLFASIDENGDGRISPAEFSDLLDELGSTLSATRRAAWFAAADGNGDGYISLEEFAAWWSTQQGGGDVT